MVVTLSLNWTHKHTYVLVRCHSWCSSGLCWRPCAKPRTSLWVWMLNFSNQHRCSLQKHTNTHLNEHVCVLMIYLSVQETQTHTHWETLITFSSPNNTHFYLQTYLQRNNYSPWTQRLNRHRSEIRRTFHSSKVSPSRLWKLLLSIKYVFHLKFQT